MPQNKKVLLNKKSITTYLKKFKKEEDVEFPELAGKLGFDEDKIPVLKIKAAGLDDHLRAKTIIERAAIMAVRIAEAFKANDPTKAINFKEMNEELRNPVCQKAFLEVSIFHRCVIKPQFTMKQSYQISQVMPEVVNRVASKALRMSSLENINGT